MRKIHLMTLLTALGLNLGLISAAASLQPAAPQTWSDGETIFHVLQKDGGLAISGRDSRSVFLMACHQAGQRAGRYVCTGNGDNEVGAFSIQNSLELSAGELRDDWTAEQNGKRVTGQSVLRPVTER